MMPKNREQSTKSGEQLCSLVTKRIIEAAKMESMSVMEYTHSRLRIENIEVRSVYRCRRFALKGTTTVHVGNFSDKIRRYKIQDDGSCNIPQILNYVQYLVAKHEIDKLGLEQSMKQDREDERRYVRLSQLHAGIGRICVECDDGSTSVSAKQLNEDEAKRVLAALADVLRPVPEPGEIWQHRKVQLPSKVISNKGMIKLEAVDNAKKVCVISRKEFAESWELLSAASEVVD